jgi:WD40 repeat protein/serine/threonine protein kinase
MNEEDIFHEALACSSPAQRAAYLEQACAGDPALRVSLEELLRANAGASGFLDPPTPPPVATLDGNSARERSGAMIGPYKLIEQIGDGGMGTVWMAQQTAPVKRLVAVKLIKAGMDSRQVIARFEAERQALALMDHANIARVLDAGTTEAGRPYFVMDLVKGIPITRYCDEHHLTPRQRLELYIPVCQAIQHAHQKGIIHRDLKPSNVLVALYDGRPVPKVIDFGVAKAAGPTLTEKTLVTGFGAIVGTLEYMSPEQAEINQLDIDTRSDIYSLGVLLYELLTGTTPLDRKRLKETSFLELLRIVREQDAPTLSNRLGATLELPSIAANRGLEPAKLTKVVRGELDWIVMKALEKDRNRRYETANSFALDVERYLNDEPVEACPPSARYRFRKFARRHKRGLLTAAVAVLAVVMTAASSGGFIWRANQNLQKALEIQRRGAYFQRIALAEREWGSNNLSRLEELLGQCPEDLQGWEWRYLKRLRYGAVSPLRHESAVYSVAFSPDGRYLATGTKDGFVRLWQTKTGQELQKWQAHENNATCVQFSRDGRRLVTGGWDAKVNCWDVDQALQGEVPAPLFSLEHSDRVRVWSLAFSPDGDRLASVGGRDEDEKGELKVWDLKTAHEDFTVDGFAGSVRCVRFTPDGRRLATSSRGKLQIWDARTGQEQLAWRDGQERRVEGLSFSPDGRRLASVAGQLSVDPDRNVIVWDARSGKEMMRMHGHVGGLRSVAFSPDGSGLASAGLDQTVKIWDATTGQEVLTLRGHLDNIFCVAFSADGHQLASASVDNTVRLWDASPWETEPTPESRTLRGHTGAVTDLAFHPTDGRRLVSADTGGTLRFWDVWSGKTLGELHVAPSPFAVRVAYSPDGGRLAALSQEPRGGGGGFVRVWEIATAKEICTFQKSLRPGALAFSPDGRHVASGGYDDVVRIWDAATAEEGPHFEGHDWPIFGVAFSPDGRHLASCSGDNTVRVWDWTTREQLPMLQPQHAGRVARVAFSGDGKLLASASWDRTVKVWDTATWRLLYDLPNPSAVHCVAFDRDGSRLVWGGADGVVTVWDAPGAETRVLRGHTNWVQAVAFNADSKLIASASLDGTVKIWEAPPKPAAEENQQGNQTAISLEDDSHVLHQD